MRWYHGRWSIRRVNAAIYLKSVACSTATTCTALTDDPNAGPGAAIATRYIGMEGGRWFPQWVSGTKTISIACPSQRVCVAVGIGAALWNGREWSNVSIATPPPDLADKRAAAERQHRRKPTGDRRGELTRTVVAKALSWGKHSPR
jgi:hypothetical protein